MNNGNSNSVLIRKRDYFRLPPEMRAISGTPMVLSTVNGRATFVPAVIIN